MSTKPASTNVPKLEVMGVKVVPLVIGGFLLFLGVAAWHTNTYTSSTPGNWQDQLSRIEHALHNATTQQCPACPACPACPSYPEQEPCAECPACPAAEATQKGGCDPHGKYDLSHLTQDETQDVGGPIQDDEALFLYSIVRGMRLSRVLEIGGLLGYSARNFLQAMTPTQGIVYTVDTSHVSPVDEKRHKCLEKDARYLTAADVDGQPLDMVFFDCHIEDVQWEMYHTLVDVGIITNQTLLAFHDTNTHPHQQAPWSYETKQGWVHQETERRMVNKFHELGWDAFMLHPRRETHNPSFPYRHGCVVMSRFEPLLVKKQE